jgi:hypothetical protein
VNRSWGISPGTTILGEAQLGAQQTACSASVPASQDVIPQGGTWDGSLCPTCPGPLAAWRSSLCGMGAHTRKPGLREPRVPCPWLWVASGTEAPSRVAVLGAGREGYPRRVPLNHPNPAFTRATLLLSV